jgi:hypothetical protein
MSDHEIPGQVTSIDMLPHNPWRIADDDVKHFLVRVRLDITPPCALPFMSASVVIDTGRVEDALLIPVEAVGASAGRQFCYVVAADGLHRRAITTLSATTDFLEVASGLEEGERVVARCSDVDGLSVDHASFPEEALSHHQHGAEVNHEKQNTSNHNPVNSEPGVIPVQYHHRQEDIEVEAGKNELPEMDRPLHRISTLSSLRS